MNTSQQQLLCLLKLVIHGGTPTDGSFSSINGKELYDLALRQNVCALLYPILSKFPEEIKLDVQIMHEWRRTSLLIITHQIRMVNGIKAIVDLFESNGILAISLKGLALKQVYPQPELRNMGDIDLFIHEEDMQKSIELLKTLGYHANSINMNDPQYMHIDMHKQDSFAVELHRTLWHPKHMKKIDNRDWFNHIWESSRRLSVEGIEFTALSLEDELINLVVHMARNLKNNNANLQQLCDIVFFLNENRNPMDSNYIHSTLKSMKLFTYYKYLLTTCNMFLGLKAPLNCGSLNINKAITLMENIINSNIYNQTTKDEEWLRKIKIFLDGISFTRKLIKPLCTRGRFLRSIGLHFRY